MDLPLADWLTTVLQIANGNEIAPLGAQLRSRLTQLIEGTLPLPGHFSHPLPPLSISLSRNRPRLVTSLTPSNQTEVEEVEQEGLLQWIAARYSTELEGVIYAVSADALGKRIRCCDQCGIFFIAKRNHRREHHFCRPEHRRAFDHEHRDPKKQAAYMRRYRRKTADHPRRRSASLRS